MQIAPQLHLAVIRLDDLAGAQDRRRVEHRTRPPGVEARLPGRHEACPELALVDGMKLSRSQRILPLSIRRPSTDPPGTASSHLAQAIGRATIQARLPCHLRETYTFLKGLAEATLAGTRKTYLAELTRVPLLIMDDLGMRKLLHTAAEGLLELIMRRYERAPRCSPRTDRSRTGASSSATPPLSGPCSTASSITRTC